MNKVIFLLISSLFFYSAQAQVSSPAVQTAQNVDLNKYLGKWYEVASIPQSFQKKCIANTTADYSMGKNNLIVVTNSCDTKSGEKSVAIGRAKIVNDSDPSKLKVTFVKLIDWIFAFGGAYWILDVDAGYNYALVGDPSREYAWILSRTPFFSNDKLILAEKHFKSQGYDTYKILSSVQTNGFSERKPICDIAKKTAL